MEALSRDTNSHNKLLNQLHSFVDRFSSNSLRSLATQPIGKYKEGPDIVFEMIIFYYILFNHIYTVWLITDI